MYSTVHVTKKTLPHGAPGVVTLDYRGGKVDWAAVLDLSSGISMGPDRRVRSFTPPKRVEVLVSRMPRMGAVDPDLMRILGPRMCAG